MTRLHAGHTRFATTSIPTESETHPHQWTPSRRGLHWRLQRQASGAGQAAPPPAPSASWRIQRGYTKQQDLYSSDGLAYAESEPEAACPQQHLRMVAVQAAQGLFLVGPWDRAACGRVHVAHAGQASWHERVAWADLPEALTIDAWLADRAPQMSGVPML